MYGQVNTMLHFPEEENQICYWSVYILSAFDPKLLIYIFVYPFMYSANIYGMTVVCHASF